MNKFANFKIIPEHIQEYLEFCKSLPPIKNELSRHLDMTIRGIINKYGWLYSKQRTAAINAAKVSRGQYQCFACKKIVKRQELDVDHCHPRTLIGQETNIATYIARTFVPHSHLRALCKSCHKLVTFTQSQERKKK